MEVCNFEHSNVFVAPKADWDKCRPFLKLISQLISFPSNRFQAVATNARQTTTMVAHEESLVAGIRRAVAGTRQMEGAIRIVTILAPTTSTKRVKPKSFTDFTLHFLILSLYDRDFRVFLWSLRYFCSQKFSFQVLFLFIYFLFAYYFLCNFFLSLSQFHSVSD